MYIMYVSYVTYYMTAMAERPKQQLSTNQMMDGALDILTGGRGGVNYPGSLSRRVS